MIRLAALLDRVVERAPLDGHAGRSGAHLERVVLDDGTHLVVKRTSPGADLVMRVTGTAVSRECRLWQAGGLDGLPHGIGHAVLGAWPDGEETVIVMRDLGSAVVGPDRRLSRRSWRGVLQAVTRLHRHWRTPPQDVHCPLRDRISIFAPWRMAPEVGGTNTLPGTVLRGWERFAEQVATDVAAEVFAVHDHPERLSDALASCACTGIHGDLWLVNLALEPQQVTLLDWDLTTIAPPALEWAYFLTGNASRVDASRDELVDDVRSASGEHHDEAALRLSLFAGLVELGWNKAFDATGHPEAAVRARERSDLDWWVAQARRTLELGLIGS